MNRNRNRIRRVALAACTAWVVAAVAAPAGASPAVPPPPGASAVPGARAAEPDPGELDDKARDRLHHAIVMTDSAQEVWSVLLGSGIDLRALMDVPREEFLDEDGREDVKRRLAEVEEFFAPGDGPAMIRDMTSTPQWQDAVAHRMIAADAPVGEDVLLLLGAHKYMDAPATEGHGERISFQVNQEKSPGVATAALGFSGELTWSGQGDRTYTVTGVLHAHCGKIGRSTTWLQYGGTDEDWKDSEETGCSDLGRSWRDITVTGTLAPNQKLELRLGTWKLASWKYSETKTYTPAPAE
ncbi:hypothetical protein ACWDRR_39075 [Kitasatospora sp. NPDC003701]